MADSDRIEQTMSVTVTKAVSPHSISGRGQDSVTVETTHIGNTKVPN